MNNNLEVITLTKKNLKEAIHQNKYWGNTYEAPFSKNKAKWMIENNRAQDDDILAVLGYENHAIVAFVSLVPDWVKTKNDGVKNIFWSQRWWAKDAYKDTILPTYAKSISLKESNNQVLIKFLGDNTKAYYEKQPFTKFSERKRYIIIFSLDYDILIYKKKSLKKIATLLKVLDRISHKMISSINTLKNKQKTRNLEFAYVSSIDKNTWHFIEKQCYHDIIPKTQDYINWQISNKQYHVVNDEANKPNNTCLLSSIANNIYNLNFLVKKERKTIGFISGFVSGNRFIVRYFCANDNHFDDCVDALIKNFIKTKCTLLQTENSILGERINNRYLAVYTDAKQLFSLVHNDVGESFKNVVVNDQDGNFF
ncbi:hypothetical protein GCM10023311_24950 [Flaviramulus aquimarinus]|uniref:GNAT family N-acetyltransferase n=1 Tax=Flaviramulus aquimarinus TaxID=1170456 RepID=A0ABP9FFF2_9FLAO